MDAVDRVDVNSSHAIIAPTLQALRFSCFYVPCERRGRVFRRLPSAPSNFAHVCVKRSRAGTHGERISRDLHLTEICQQPPSFAGMQPGSEKITDRRRHNERREQTQSLTGAF
jgi:hypothetical protein